MNERIRELAEQAKQYAINQLDETGELHKYYDVYFEKFAELIVRECAEICLEANDHKNILRHFGVEE